MQLAVVLQKILSGDITSNHNVCAYNVYSQVYFNLDVLKATKLEFKNKSVSEICNNVML